MLMDDVKNKFLFINILYLLKKFHKESQNFRSPVTSFTKTSPQKPSKNLSSTLKLGILGPRN